jgi:hypothetical protein
VLVAELISERRLETTRGSSLPSAAHQERAINSPAFDERPTGTRGPPASGRSSDVVLVEDHDVAEGTASLSNIDFQVVRPR